MADEIGDDGTYHTHLYMACSSAVRFSTIKNKFNGGHFEMCRDTSQQNRDYIYKESKEKNKNKGETHIKETREEYGEMPIERQGVRNDLADLYDMIKQGVSNIEIIEQCPQYMFNIEKIEKARQMIREEKYKRVRREIHTTYVYGETGVGKTRDLMDKYEGDIYRVTDYEHPFDGYAGEDVLVFEEFRSNIKIGDMLNYLDRYALKLPARYFQRVACYTKVYIVTNIPIEEQYTNVQKDSYKTWQAFLRRIHTVREYKKDNVTEQPLNEVYWYQDDLDALPV
jgi:hypothetical protein